ncbi:MAG: DUF1080 domain-containing protein [Vicinamibacterales bacterium]
MQKVTRFSAALIVIGLSTIAVLAQRGPAPSAQAQPAPAQGAGRGGGGGAAVVFTPAQLMALGAIAVPQPLIQAVTDARNDLARASLTLPVDTAAIRAKTDVLVKAETALAVERASQFARAGGPSLGLTPEQVASIVAGNGLPRGGLSSPGGTLAADDYTGFTKIFDGKTFTGWSGETDGWIIGDDALQFSVQRLPGQHHVHFIGVAGVSPILKDFDFKVEMRVAQPGNYNGGIQYRSRLLSAAHSADGKARAMYDPATIADPLGKMFPANITTLAAATQAGLVPAGAGNPWQVSGYQLDITPGFGGIGSLYEGQGRGVIVNGGEFVQLYPNGLKFVIGRAAENAPQYNKPQGEWNQLEVIARGNTLVHMVNGHVVAIAIDDDPVRRAYQGMLSLQCEGGEIWYRNIYLKHLEPIVK